MKNALKAIQKEFVCKNSTYFENFLIDFVIIFNKVLITFANFLMI
jgi:hypothetical protein